MLDLNFKVFGNIIFKEIIGSEPSIQNMEEKIKSEYKSVLKNLDGKNQNELYDILQKQKNLEKEVNIKPGSMALSQKKISLFLEFSQKYQEELQKKITTIDSSNRVH